MSLQKATLDKDLAKISRLETATKILSSGLVAHTSALLFLITAGFIGAFFTGVETEKAIIVFAAILGGYMALNIGAN
ncbi:inorganic phosphate transporter, partial [Rhodospirillaceae bacterium]|nr:inorganic phosphate transporter [Rhodospirillaceae bacterium]